MNIYRILLTSSLLLLICAICNGTTFLVTSTANTGNGSLRDAVATAMAGDTITFSESINGQPILLQFEILLDKRVWILGNGQSMTIIDGQQTTRILRTTSNEEIYIQDLTVTNGRRVDGAGGISNIGVLKMVRCCISNNTGFSNLSTTFGGGVVNSGTMVLEDCRIIENLACSDVGFSQGGGVCNFGSATFINCHIAGNHALAKAADKFALGGGVYTHETSALFTNCAFTGNLAEGNSSFGGGLYIGGNGSNVQVVNTTSSGNQAKANTTASGGGIYRGGSGTFTMTNSIVAGNKDGGFGPDIIIFGSLITDGGNNLIGDTTGVSNRFPNSVLKGSSSTPIDPVFVGKVDTTSLPNLSGDVQLTATSPAFNAGTPDTTGLALPMHDLSGRQRINGMIDIGAYEYCPATWVIQSSDLDMANTFLANNTIQIEPGANFPGSEEFWLNAPEVLFTSDNALSGGTILTIEQQGCQ